MSKSEFLTKGLGLGVELAFYVLFFIFAGYYIGNEISEMAGRLGMVFGSFLGFVIGMYRANKVTQG